MKYFVPPILAILITSGAWPSQSHQPMPPDAQPAFEVATISMGRGGGNLFSSSNHSVKDLIAFAYLLHPNQIVGGPARAKMSDTMLRVSPILRACRTSPSFR
jgi:hypothetical protein